MFTRLRHISPLVVARHRAAPGGERTGSPQDEVVVRRATVEDAGALERLAALDSKPTPQGPVLVAESRGRIVAAQPLGDGPAIADPFTPTADLVTLLEVRAAQLNGRDRPAAAGLARRGSRVERAAA